MKNESHVKLPHTGALLIARTEGLSSTSMLRSLKEQGKGCSQDIHTRSLEYVGNIVSQKSSDIRDTTGACSPLSAH